MGSTKDFELSTAELYKNVFEGESFIIVRLLVGVATWSNRLESDVHKKGIQNIHCIVL